MANEGRINASGGIEVPAELLLRHGLQPGAPLVVERLEDGLLLLPARCDAKRIYIEPTGRCNLACATCMRHAWDEQPGDLDYDLFAGLVPQLRAFPELETAHFAGFGEPLYHPRILDMLQALRDTGIKTEMTSNGVLLDRERARRLVEVGLHTLIISVDGVQPETYSSVRPGSELNQVLENARQIIAIAREMDSPLRVGLEFVAMRRNYQELPELLRLAADMQAHFFVVSNLLPYTREMAAEALYGDGRVELPVSPWYVWHWGFSRIQLPQMALRTERQCRFVSTSSFVLAWDGKVSPCYGFLHSHTVHAFGREKEMRRWVVGDVREQSLADIWTAPDYVRFRSRVRRFDFPSCADCSSVDGCYFSQSNEEDCWGNRPTCADCLWSRGIVRCY